MENVFSNFIVNAGLYESLEVTKENIDDLCALLDGKARISVYCTQCKEVRVFSMEPITFSRNSLGRNKITMSLGTELKGLQNHQQMVQISPGSLAGRQEKTPTAEWYWKNRDIEDATRLMCLSFSCAMDPAHKVDYILWSDDSRVVKIGQYPSVADLTMPELKNFKKVISDSDMKEIRRAIGLHAQGIGVGSYVYLRRIFERILERAKDTAVSDDKINLELYKKAHVDERITMLADYLPEMMVKNPGIYGIISKGIHELSEEECIAYFPVMQESIFMILRQWEQKRKEAEDAKKLSNAIAKIAGSIK